jgi:hypothetical protein
MMKALREAKSKPESRPEDATPSWWMSALGSAARAFSRWLDRPRTPRASNPALPAAPSSNPSAGAGSNKQLVVFPGGAPSGPSIADRLGDAMRAALAKFLLSTNLAEMMSRKQAEYMKETMDMFERGDLAGALRRAVPLAGDTSDGEATPSFALPTPRDDLAIHGNRPRGTGSMFSTDDVYERLRKLYQQAFERLEREGKIEEAAFVLAELLGRSEEAVAFLERHEKLKLAAEVAEARGLSPGLVVRQLYLAGMRERAIKLARYKDVFADAVLRLESSGKHEAAAELRVAWAKSLAFSGQLLAAVDVMWPVERERAIALGWLRDVVDFGGPSAVRAMVRLMLVAPESDAEVARLTPRIEEILRGGATTARDRAALVDAFGAATIPDLAGPVHSLVRSTARAALIDLRAESPDRPTADRVRSLVNACGDAALRADLPSISSPAALPSLAPPRHLVVEHLDVGLVAIHDVISLPDGRIVAALGELGVWFLTQDGRTIARFDLPATSLVEGPGGVIALVRRGDLWKLSRINLITRQSAPWIEIRLSCWAPTFDGSIWYVGVDDALVAIDTHSDDAEAAWRLPRCGSEIRAVHHAKQQVSFLTREPADERWTLQLPAHTVTSRVSASIEPSRIIDTPHPSGWASVDAGGSVAVLGLNRPPGAAPGALLPEVWTLAPGARAVPNAPSIGTFRADPIQTQLAYSGRACREVLAPHIASSGVVLSVLTESGATIERVPLGSMTAVDEISLGGAKRVSIRLDANQLVIGDDRGRILVIDMTSGRLLSSIRTGRR